MTAKKTAAKKASQETGTKNLSVDVTPSVALVRATIDALRARGEKVRGIGAPAKRAQALDPRVLANLKLQGGEALPVSLVTWLAYDARAIDPVDENGRLKTTTLRAFVTEVIHDLVTGLDDGAFDAGRVIESILSDQGFPDAPALQLPDAGSQVHFLVFDGSEEPAVLGYEKEEFWVKYQTFGEFVADWFRS